MDGGVDELTPRRRGRGAITAVAFAAIVAAPLLAGALSTRTPAAVLGLPFETIAILLILLAVGGDRTRAVIAAVFGVVVVLSLLVAALDLGFAATIDRGFSIVGDVPAVLSAVAVIGDAAGTVNAILVVGVIAVVLAASAVGLARAALRAGHATARSGRSGRVALAAAAAVWMISALSGAQLVSDVPFAAAGSTRAIAATWAHSAQSLRDLEGFERALVSDPLRDAQGARLLAALDGKDVVIAFVESYGEIAVQETSFTADVADVLRAGDAQLARQGYSARSAFLTSPTFGGVSWLAHATLQSGVWADSQGKYDRLTSSDRLTLTQLFADAGWRTVGVVPSNTEPWPIGTSFYGYHELLDARSIGYQGPAFSYARVPDQFTWKAFHERELSRPHAPVMAEVDLVSSHTPWTPLPRLLPWAEVGDGSSFADQPGDWPTPVEAWTDPQRVRELYGQSIAYALETVFSYLAAYDQPDLVLILVGDHQPARIVSGPRADRDVPITIIAKDAAVLDRLAPWGWEQGVRPSANAPVWRMDRFRDRFVLAFTP